MLYYISCLFVLIFFKNSFKCTMICTKSVFWNFVFRTFLSRTRAKIFFVSRRHLTPVLGEGHFNLFSTGTLSLEMAPSKEMAFKALPNCLPKKLKQSANQPMSEQCLCLRPQLVPFCMGPNPLKGCRMPKWRGWMLKAKCESKLKMCQGPRIWI